MSSSFAPRASAPIMMTCCIAVLSPLKDLLPSFMLAKSFYRIALAFEESMKNELITDMNCCGKVYLQDSR